MSIKTPIAQRNILAIDRDGQEFTLTIGIGQPYEIAAGDWACPVWMYGMYDLVDQHGVDSWQSIQLAARLIGQLLGYFIRDDGGQLLWPENRAPMEISEIVPQVTLIDI